MNRDLHLLVHWVDNLRHYLASCFNAQAVGGNTGAAVYWSVFAALVSYALWPKVRHHVDAWVKGHFARHHEEMKQLLSEHHEAIRQTLAEHHDKISKLLGKD